MTISNSTLRLAANWRGIAIGAFVLSVAALSAQGVVATDPFGYIVTTAKGGTRSNPGMSFVSPALANPVEWQGQLTAVSGATLAVANANWQANRWDSRYCLEIVSGPYAGVWTPIVSAAGDQLIVADTMDALLAGDETVRIRRFTTLSDFLGAENEAGLQAGNEIALADVVTVYHAHGIKNYWYYNGADGGNAGWVDATWEPAGDVIIAPGEGVVLNRKNTGQLPIYQVGTVKTGQQGVIVDASFNVVGGVTTVNLRLGDSRLYTGTTEDGISSGPELALADNIVIYGDLPRTYWYYDGSDGGGAGWRDASWNLADDQFIPAGSTFVLNRKFGGPFLWFLPSIID